MRVGRCGEGPHHSAPAWTVSRLQSEPEPRSQGRHVAGASNDSKGTCPLSSLGPWNAYCVPDIDLNYATCQLPQSSYQPCEVDPLTPLQMGKLRQRASARPAPFPGPEPFVSHLPVRGAPSAFPPHLGETDSRPRVPGAAPEGATPEGKLTVTLPGARPFSAPYPAGLRRPDLWFSDSLAKAPDGIQTLVKGQNVTVSQFRRPKSWMKGFAGWVCRVGSPEGCEGLPPARPASTLGLSTPPCPCVFPSASIPRWLLVCYGSSNTGGASQGGTGLVPHGGPEGMRPSPLPASSAGAGIPWFCGPRRFPSASLSEGFGPHSPGSSP